MWVTDGWPCPYSNSVVQQLNCSNDDKQKILSCIRNSSFDNLFKAYGDRYTRPIIDDYFFPLYPLLHQHVLSIPI